MRISMIRLVGKMRSAFEGQRSFASNSQCGMVRFENFPEACCEFSSWMMCRYLYRKSIAHEISIIKGLRIGSVHDLHAWIKARGFSIDVTADQFSGQREVCKRRSLWHQMNFEVIDRDVYRPTLLDDWDEEEAQGFLMYYDRFEAAVDSM